MFVLSDLKHVRRAVKSAVISERDCDGDVNKTKSARGMRLILFVSQKERIVARMKGRSGFLEAGKTEVSEGWQGLSLLALDKVKDKAVTQITFDGDCLCCIYNEVDKLERRCLRWREAARYRSVDSPRRLVDIFVSCG